MKKLNGFLFIVLFVTLGIAFFTRNNLRSVQEIAPEVLKQPLQSQLIRSKIIRFTRNDYAYELTPVYAYDISGLITSKLNYSIFTIYKSEKIFSVDLCLIWGSNAASRIFKDQGVNFSQDCRFCWVHWCGKKEFNLQEFSNNHLLIVDPVLEKKIRGFHEGDQVRIWGELVNVKGKLFGRGGRYDPPEIIWKTSVSRSDSGAGACEVIYVEDAEVLKRANTLSCDLFIWSAYGLCLWLLFNLLNFIREIIEVSKGEITERKL